MLAVMKVVWQFFVAFKAGRGVCVCSQFDVVIKWECGMVVV